ncbi:MAG: hypothetical protein ABEK12_01495 [Candidatus Nanohaloarchaea archaeon]
MVAANESTDSTVQINAVILMSLTFDTIDFGTLDPGVTNRSAIGNSNLTYNVTFDEDSITADALWLKSTPIVSELDDSYEIGPSNLTVHADPGIKTNLSTNYSRIATGISPGTTVNTFHFIDIPLGMTAGPYNGTMTFKANATR